MKHETETFHFHAKDFFGDAAEATLRFMSKGEIVFESPFENGILPIRVPEDVEPGVYDLVAQRGDQEYRIVSYMVPLATHYFRHAQLHGDIRLKGENFDPNTIFDISQFHPLLEANLSKIPEGFRPFLDEVSRNSGNSNTLAWGGVVHLNGFNVEVSAGEAIYDGLVYSWPDTSFDIPVDRGVYQIGLLNGGITIGNNPLFPFAKIIVDSNDFVRLEVSLTYHTITRGENAFFFLGYERTTEDVTIPRPTQKRLSGTVFGDRIYGRAYSPSEVSKISLSFSGIGPVFYTKQLYLHATEDYFLLFDRNRSEGTLLSALPRHTGSKVIVDWQDRLSFTSSGEEGDTSFVYYRPYDRSFAILCDGMGIQTKEVPLRMVSEDFGVLATSNDPTQWGQTVTTGATLEWI